jgi:mannose-6-phosphate isomerase
MIGKKPYLLYNKIQKYEWGTRDDKAFIPKFLGIPAEPDVPYAELWIGAHPSASSEIETDEGKIPLHQAIQMYPKEILGAYVAGKFNNELPFLLKILSAAQALSIQTHPTKEQAVRLHAKDSRHYPDNNHKPEIAIAVDSLTAIAGFRPVQEIVANLRRYPELSEFVGTGIVEEIAASRTDAATKVLIQQLYRDIMHRSDDTAGLTRTIEAIAARLKSVPSLSAEERQLLKQHAVYGNDVGLFSFLLFNNIRLRSGQAIFTHAGVPHAYIEGTIVECMANSDNVVRAGLTGKFKDVDTLLEIMRYDFSEYEILNKEQQKDGVNFPIPAEEFVIAQYHKESAFSLDRDTNNRPTIILVMAGSVDLHVDDGENSPVRFSKGEAFLIPALVSRYHVKGNSGASFFSVTVP